METDKPVKKPLHTHEPRRVSIRYATKNEHAIAELRAKIAEDRAQTRQAVNDYAAASPEEGRQFRNSAKRRRRALLA